MTPPPLNPIPPSPGAPAARPDRPSDGAFQESFTLSVRAGSLPTMVEQCSPLQYIELVRVGGTSLSPWPALEGADWVDKPEVVDGHGNPIREVVVSLLLKGESGTLSAGISALTLDADDRIVVNLVTVSFSEVGP